MGDKDQGQPARTIAPNAPVFTGLLTFTAGGAPDPTRLIIPLTFSEFTEAFLVSISNRPTQVGNSPAALQFLVNSNMATKPPQLAQAEFILPGCSYRQPMPGWLQRITIDGRGVAPDDFSVARSVTAQVVVYRLDRVTRDDWKGAR
jgi:hypothetical protein